MTATRIPINIVLSLALLSCSKDAMAPARANGGESFPSAAAVLTPNAVQLAAASIIFGANFQIRSQLDNNFCIKVADGTSEGRTLALAQCAGVQTQQWMFTQNRDDTNFLVEAAVGLCVQAERVGNNPSPVVDVAKCGARDERFIVTVASQIQSVRRGTCLSVPGAAVAAPLSQAPCDETKKTQLWNFTK